ALCSTGQDWLLNRVKETVCLTRSPPSSSCQFVPLVVEMCCGLVEQMGLEYTGIYRVPGNNALVSTLQEQLNKGMDINPAEEKWQDLNVVSSLLKSFFRKLPEPLFTDGMWTLITNSCRLPSRDEFGDTHAPVHDLPDYYYHTLKFLMGHLKTYAWFFSEELDKDEKGSWGSKRDLNAKDLMSIVSAVTRKRKKRPKARLRSSSTDEDSEHEPVKASHRGGGDTAPKAEGEEDEEDEEEEEEEVGKEPAEEERHKVEEEEESRPRGALVQEDGGLAEKAALWRGPEDARSIVSGYSTLSTLGRGHASEGRADEADDERSELLIQCDTLARKKLKADKNKARPASSEPLPEEERTPEGPATEAMGAAGSEALVGSRKENRGLGHAPPPALAAPEAASFSLQGSLADQVRARLLGSADDLRGVGLRKPPSPETQRRRRAWRRHTVVVGLAVCGGDQVPAEQGRHEPAASAARHTSTSTLHQYL
ncbi:hypothetical protein Z043_109375, partial [Scleropages formosus]